MKSVVIILTAILLACSFQKTKAASWRNRTENADYIHRSIKQVTDVMVYDIYSPPVASRTYAYVCIAAYEAVITGNVNYNSFAGQLHQLKPVPKPEAGKECSSSLAAVQAILTVGKSLVISEEKIESFKKGCCRSLKKTGYLKKYLKTLLLMGKR